MSLHLDEPNSSTLSNGVADQGRKRFSVNFVCCPGSTSTRVLLLGSLPLPIEIRRVVRRNLDVRPAGKDRVLFRAPTTKKKVFYAIHLVELGRVVPMLAITKIICDRVRPLAAFGHFLEG